MCCGGQTFLLTLPLLLAGTGVGTIGTPWALNNQSLSHAEETKERASERARKTGLARKDPPMDYTDKPNDWRGLEDGKCSKTRSAVYCTQEAYKNLHSCSVF